MKKIRSLRGKPAIEVPQMPNKKDWESYFIQKFSNINYIYLSTFREKRYSCETLRVEVEKSLVSHDSYMRDWGRSVLEYIGFPIA